jgi:UDP-glucuronate 4-epimerase
MNRPQKILVTGAAGFIGYHLSQKLLSLGHSITGIDNLNDYYEPALKLSRLALLKDKANFTFYNLDLKDSEQVEGLFADGAFDVVVHLAAQAGVRYSIQNPHAYIDSNIKGFLNILEGSRHHRISHLIYASSSSVYGANTKMPFSVHDRVDHPISLYAATKKSNELMAHTYSHLYNIPTTGLRFFTVYGPWGRPDMAYFLFTRAILEGKPIKVFNNGQMQRDFTYVDDIVEGIARLIPQAPKPNPNWTGLNPDPASSFAPYRIYNIGNNQPVQLLRFIEVLEKELGKEAKKEFLPMQDGDVVATFANVDDLMHDVGFKPATSIENGLAQFVKWYLDYYRIN